MTPVTLPATIQSVEQILRYVVKAAREAGLAPKAVFRLRLAVDEIATNIITHGYAEAGITGDITVMSTVAKTALIVLLEDNGTPFDPRSHNLPDEQELATPLEERSIGGLGIFLVLKGVDRFMYEYANGCNRNIFIMNLPTQGELTKR